VIEGGPDTDITDHVPEGSDMAKALARMKAVDPDFSVDEFLQGARGAYEMILMAFESSDLDSILPFLSRDVFNSFDEVVQMRETEGLAGGCHIRRPARAEHRGCQLSTRPRAKARSPSNLWAS
jgi:hypothetical protein